MATGTAVAELSARVASLDWYHTLELAPGLLTPGWFDTRQVPARLPFPSLLDKRCLDIGTFDGFWAFEMERRGAREVLAIDVLDPLQWDWPSDAATQTVEAVGRRKAHGIGFEVAREALESSVQRLERSVYDLTEEEVGIFDFIYLGSLLLHLRDPVRALERVRDVCAGELVVVDAVDPYLSVVAPRRPAATLEGRGRPWWWKPNRAGLVRLIEAGGFVTLAPPKPLLIPPGTGQGRPPLSIRTLASKPGREAMVSSMWGDPHAAVRVKPRR